MNVGDDTEVRVMLKHPIFSIDEVLGFSLADVRNLAARRPDRIFQRIEEYVDAEREREETLRHTQILTALKRGTEFEAAFEKWDRMNGFLLAADKPVVIERSYSQYVEQTAQLAELAIADSDADSVDTYQLTCVFQFLVVTTRVSQISKEAFVQKEFRRFDELVAALVNTDPARLHSAGRAVPFLRIVTSLLCILVINSKLAGGLNCSTFDNALQLKQRLGPMSWEKIALSDRFRFALCSLWFALAVYGDRRPFESVVGFSDNSLNRLRHILVDGMESVPHPTTAIYASVFRYFIDQIDRGINYRSIEFRIIQENFTDVDRTEILRLADKFRVYHNGVTFERLVRFLAQFQTLQKIRAALVLLRSIKFYTLATIQTMLESVTQYPGEGAPHVVVPLGNLGGSTSLMHYLVSHWSLGELKIENDLERVLTTTPDSATLYFIDDCTLSGTQTINTFAEFLGKRELKSHHEVHCRPLLNPDALMHRPIVLIYAIASHFACDRLRASLAALGLNHVTITAAAYEDIEVKPFTSSMEYIWDERGQREMLAAFLSDVGYSILEKRSEEKKWTDERRRESALGFSDFQRLIVFQYNVPKTTVAPLWETGSFQGKEWMPLFPVAD